MRKAKRVVKDERIIYMGSYNADDGITDPIPWEPVYKAPAESGLVKELDLLGTPKEYYIDNKCELCHRSENECICPECYQCGAIGDPRCKAEHHQMREPKLKAHKKSPKPVITPSRFKKEFPLSYHFFGRKYADRLAKKLEDKKVRRGNRCKVA